MYSALHSNGNVIMNSHHMMFPFIFSTGKYHVSERLQVQSIFGRFGHNVCLPARMSLLIAQFSFWYKLGKLWQFSRVCLLWYLDHQLYLEKDRYHIRFCVLSV